MKRSGQITVLVLLLSLLGLTTALSVASRSLSDLKQVSQVDVGTKAFAAAEAGLEYALNDFSKNLTEKCTTPVSANLTIPGIKPGGITYTICANSANYALLPNVSKDDVFQLHLPPNNPNNLKTLNVLWDNPASSIEVEVMDDQSNIVRYYFNSPTQSKPNGFLSSYSASSCIVSGGWCDDPAFSTWSSCAVGIPNIDKAVLIRVKPFYQTTSIGICGITAGNSGGRIPQQMYTITVTAETTNGTIKKIQAIKTPPTLPALFDNVLFSNSGITK